jgi:hypothetical protein
MLSMMRALYGLLSLILRQTGIIDKAAVGPLLHHTVRQFFEMCQIEGQIELTIAKIY